MNFGPVKSYLKELINVKENRNERNYIFKTSLNIEVGLNEPLHVESTWLVINLKYIRYIYIKNVTFNQ